MLKSILGSFRAMATGLLALALAAAAPGAQAQADPAGLSSLLMPLVVISSPFLGLRALFSGEVANRRANEAWDQARLALSRESRPPLPVHALYVGHIPMQLVLKDTLSYLAIPAVEMDSSSAAWLLNGFDNRELARESEHHPYVRVAVAEQGDRRCVQWSKDWTRQFPLPGRRCLAVELVDSLASDVELKLDTSRIEDRHLEWQIVELSSHALRYASPFWPSHPERSGTGETTVEYSFNSDFHNALALALQQLSPAVVTRDDHGVPLAPRWVKAKPRLIFHEHYKSIPVPLGPMNPDPMVVRDSQLPWVDQVDQSYELHVGRMVANSYAILPTRDVVMEVGQEYQTKYFVVGASVYSATLSGQRIVIGQDHDDARQTRDLALDLDKAPYLDLCTEQEKVRCSALLNVASVSADAVDLQISVLGWRARRVSYLVTVPAAWLTD